MCMLVSVVSHHLHHFYTYYCKNFVTLVCNFQTAYLKLNIANRTLPLTGEFSTAVYDELARNSAIANKPCHAFRGQSRSPNVVRLHMLGLLRYRFLLMC